MIDGLQEHIEEHLGPATGGWQRDPDGNAMRFQVVEHEPTDDGLVVYSTLGLSEFVLGSSRSDDQFRVEQIMIAGEELRGGPIPAIMFELGNEMIDRGTVASIGDLFDGSAWLHNISDMPTIYTGRCLYHPLAFQSFTSGDVVVGFEWMIPVHPAEADYVRKHGWRDFEHLMKAENPDPTDFRRPPMLVEVP